MLYCQFCKDQENIERKGDIIRSEKVARTMYGIDNSSCILTQRRRRVCEVCGYRWTTFEINRDDFIKLTRYKDAIELIRNGTDI